MPRMLRRKLATGAVVAAVVVGGVVVGGGLFEWFRTPGSRSAIPPAPPTTESGPLTFDAPPGTAVPIDPTTTTVAPVESWKVNGSCSKSGRAFLCKVTVTASNHLQYGGVVA